MTYEIIFGSAGFLILCLTGILIFRRKPRRLKIDKFQRRWLDIMGLIKSRQAWSEVLVSADKLLDEALRRRRFGGKSMGERLVSAQRNFSDNDTLWYAHKLRNKLDSNPKMKLKKKELQTALTGIRQALVDLGALKNGKNNDEK